MPITEYIKVMSNYNALTSNDPLTAKINADPTISPKTVDHINWEAPDGLHVFMSDLLTTGPGSEEEALDSTILAFVQGSGVQLEAPYIVTTKSQGKVTSIKHYATDNGDDTYALLVREEVFTWNGNSVTKKEVKDYYSDGVLKWIETVDYYTSSTGEIIEKNRGITYG